MSNQHLRLYVYEAQLKDDIPLYEWLLSHAKQLGIKGGTVFRSIASFGYNQVVHEEHFFEMGADLAVEVSFIVTQTESDKMITLLKENHIRAFYLISEVRSGYTA